jgi:hypothetical protein
MICQQIDNNWNDVCFIVLVISIFSLSVSDYQPDQPAIQQCFSLKKNSHSTMFFSQKNQLDQSDFSRSEQADCSFVLASASWL